MFKDDGNIHASIFIKAIREIAEVYGLFIDKAYQHRNIQKRLIKAALSNLDIESTGISEIICFVDEDNVEEIEAALALGFEVVDTYRCYKCVF